MSRWQVEEIELAEYFRVVYPPDREWAEDVFRRLGEPSGLPEDFPIEELAARHAKYGRRRSELFCHLDRPRHPAEELVLQIWQEKIDFATATARGAEIDRQPLTLHLLQCVRDDIEDRLEHYSHFMQLVSQISLNQRSDCPRNEWEPVVSYYARECYRFISFTPTQFVAFCEQIDELRCEAGKEKASVGKFSGNCAFFVALQVFERAAKLWFSQVRTAELSRTDPR
jgi:hypothetical protein